MHSLNQQCCVGARLIEKISPDFISQLTMTQFVEV